MFEPYNPESSIKQKKILIDTKTKDILKLLKLEYLDANEKDLTDIIGLMMPGTKDKINALDNNTFLNLFADFCGDFNITKLKQNRAYEPFRTKLEYIETIYPFRFENKPPIKITNFDKIKEKIRKICIKKVNRESTELNNPSVIAAANRALDLSTEMENPYYLPVDDAAADAAIDKANAEEERLTNAFRDQEEYNAAKSAYDESDKFGNMDTFENTFQKPDNFRDNSQLEKGGRKQKKTKRRKSSRKRRGSRRKRRGSRRKGRSYSRKRRR